MATTEVTISKGSFSATIYANQVSEEYSNKIFLITPPQTANNQASGPKDVKWT